MASAGAGSANGGSTSAAGAQSVGGSAVKVSCTLGKTDLMQIASSSPDGNWIGGEVTRNDDPCGFQGKLYAISDPGPDAIPGGDDASLEFPAWVQGTTDYGNPCSGGKCCIRGKTSLWPKLPDGSTVFEYSWGAALVLSLSAIDPLDNGAVLPYVGPAKGFRMVLEGDLAGGQTLRVAFNQRRSNDREQLAYTPFTSLGEKDVMFENVSCPSWATDCTDTGYGGPHPYALWLMVVGGDDAGYFDVCVTSIVPI